MNWFLFYFALYCPSASSIKLNTDDLQCQLAKADVKSDSKEAAQRAYNSISETVMANLENVDVGYTCLLQLSGVMDDPIRGPWLAETQAQDAIMAYVKTHKNNRDIQMNLCFLVGGGYGVPQPVTERTRDLGGFTHLFEQITLHSDDPDFQMQMYRALSDPSYTAAGADSIANNGGPFKGIDFLVNEMKTHPQPHLAECPKDHLSLKYEIMQVSAGVLSNDPEKKFAARFMEDNFIDQILYSMQVEPDLRGTVDCACHVIAELTQENQKHVQAFVERNAIAILQNATVTFHDMDTSKIDFGSGVMGTEYPVIPNCVGALTNILHAGGEAVKNSMMQLGLDKTLASARQDFAPFTQPLRVALTTN